MGFDTLVRSGIALANKLTASLQGDITLEAWTGTTGYGAATYAAPITFTAIIEYKTEGIQGTSSDLVQAKTKVTILEPITPNGATGRQEPVDPRDRVTLPDGQTGPIVNVDFLLDPVTGAPYMFTILLGASPGTVSA